MHLLFKTDSHAKSQNQIIIEETNSLGPNIIKTLKDFPNDDLFVHDVCLKQLNCYNLKIIDGENNGNGWYDVIFGGKSLLQNSFALF